MILRVAGLLDLKRILFLKAVKNTRFLMTCWRFVDEV